MMCVHVVHVPLCVCVSRDNLVESVLFYLCPTSGSLASVLKFPEL